MSVSVVYLKMEKCEYLDVRVDMRLCIYGCLWVDVCTFIERSVGVSVLSAA